MARARRPKSLGGTLATGNGLPSTAAFENEVEPEVAPEIATFRVKESTRKRSGKHGEKRSGKGAQKDTSERSTKPPSIKGIEWSPHPRGGWQARTFDKDESGQPINRRYLGYLGKRQWLKMRSEYQGEVLREAVIRWIAEAKTKKGIQ